MQQFAVVAALRWPTLLPPMSQAANQLVGSRRQTASAAAAHKMQNSQHQLLKTFRTKTSFPQWPIPTDTTTTNAQSGIITTDTEKDALKTPGFRRSALRFPSNQASLCAPQARPFRTPRVFRNLTAPGPPSPQARGSARSRPKKQRFE
jgi:hypothetical protein